MKKYGHVLSLAVLVFLHTNCKTTNPDNKLNTASSAVKEKILLISDIDDTIKPTHVKSIEAVSNSLAKSSFLGLSSIYTALICAEEFEAPTYSDCIITKGMSVRSRRSAFYVTGFPILAEAVKYIEVTKFPYNGELRSKPSWKSMLKYKVDEHVDIIKQYPDRDVILIGDNGQKDIEVFIDVQKEIEYLYSNGVLPRVPRFYVFVHQVYNLASGGNLIPAPQIPFLTYFDLGLAFASNGLIDERQLKRTSAVFKDTMANTASTRFTELLPKWIECQNYRHWYSAGNGTVFTESDEILNANARFKVSNFLEHDVEIFETFLELNCS